MKNHNADIYLTPDWIVENLKDTAVHQWKTNPGRWHKVVPGFPKDHVSIISSNIAPILNYTNQKLKYTQGNLHLYMLASFSSCSYHMGMMEKAENVM